MCDERSTRPAQALLRLVEGYGVALLKGRTEEAAAILARLRVSIYPTDDEILEEYSKHVHVAYCGGVNVLSAMQPEGFVDAVRALMQPRDTRPGNP